MEKSDALFIISTLVTIFFGIVARKQILGFFKRFSSLPFIAVLGPKKVGKTSLICYLRGEPVPTEYYETFAANKVGKITFDLTGDKMMFFRTKPVYDVGGDWVNQWKVLIKQQNPEGIIFVVDTTNHEEEIEKLDALLEIYEEWTKDVFVDFIKLRVILFLLNKADVWGEDTQKRNNEIENYSNMIFKVRIDRIRRQFKGIIIQFGWSALTVEDCRENNNHIIRKFAIDLERKKNNNGREQLNQ